METPFSLSSPQISELKQAFLLFDKDKQGVINSKDLHLVIESLGFPINEAQIFQLLEGLGVHTRSLDFPEFVTLLTNWEMNPRNKHKEFTATWERIEGSGKGFITTEELKEFLHSVGESMSNHDFEKFLADSEILNEDKVITREAFLSMF